MIESTLQPYLRPAFMTLAFLVCGVIKFFENKRTKIVQQPMDSLVLTFGAIVGALLGAKLGMIMFLPFETFLAMLANPLGPYDGHTLLGALGGGFLGVELAKSHLKIRQYTGDNYALAIPVGIAIGRVGCYFNGCCHGIPGHPYQLYETAALIVVSLGIWYFRKARLPSGILFRLSLISYLLIRISLEPFRGDSRLYLGPVSLPTLFCIGFIGIMILSIRRIYRTSKV